MSLDVLKVCPIFLKEEILLRRKIASSIFIVF